MPLLYFKLGIRYLIIGVFLSIEIVCTAFVFLAFSMHDTPPPPSLHTEICMGAGTKQECGKYAFNSR